MISSALLDAESPETPSRVVRATLLAVRGIAQSATESLPDVEDASLIDMLTDLRRLRSATAAVEAQVQVAFDTAQRRSAMARGVPRKDAGKGVAEQVALARGVSSYRAANDLALARGLVGELPATLSKLITGAASEPAVLNVARETVCLMPEDRAVVDSRVADRIDGMSPRRAGSLARAESARVDAESVVRRIRQAEKDRRVTVRPAPDAMAYVSALLPVKEAVAAYAALTRQADALRAGGDERSRGAIMADTLVARLTGIEEPDQVSVEVQLVMPAETLLATRDDASSASTDGEPTAPDAADEAAVQLAEPCGWIDEHPIPAAIARQIALCPDEGVQRWIRRLFTDPISGDVTAVDTKRRLFTGAMRRAIIARDQVCRGCGAQIRHLDHITAHAAGGATSMLNGQGLCERCNQAKAQPGWSANAFMINGRHVTVTRTPTGHRYVSLPPPSIIDPPPREAIPLEQRLTHWIQRSRIGPTLRTRSVAIDVVHPAMD